MFIISDAVHFTALSTLNECIITNEMSRCFRLQLKPKRSFAQNKRITEMESRLFKGTTTDVILLLNLKPMQCKMS